MLKEKIVTTPILTLPVNVKGYQVFSYASKNGLECVLMEDRKVITYASRLLRPQEVNYLTHDLMLAAIIFTLYIWLKLPL